MRENIEEAIHKIRSVLSWLPSLMNDVSVEEIMWAYMAVNSRCVYLKSETCCSVLTSRSEENSALAPFLDLLNHSYEADIDAYLDSADDCYKIRTNKSIQKYDQAFINYGGHDNVKLFVEYGFIIPGNPNDGYVIEVESVVMAIRSVVLNSISKNLKEEVWVHVTDIGKRLSLSKSMFITENGPSWSLEVIILTVINFLYSKNDDKYSVQYWEIFSQSDKCYVDKESPYNKILVEVVTLIMAEVSEEIATCKTRLLELSDGELNGHKEVGLALMCEFSNINNIAIGNHQTMNN